MEGHRFYNRDLSWLTFNELVMQQAAREEVPLLERLKFLGIFSSNLDEFYRVRMPVLRALHSIGTQQNTAFDADYRYHILKQARDKIDEQQSMFGKILTAQVIPALKKNNIDLLYNQMLPAELVDELRIYFLSEVLAYLQPVILKNDASFFPENNKLYFIVHFINLNNEEDVAVLNIPSPDDQPRFRVIKHVDKQYVIFIDDVIRYNLSEVFIGVNIKGCYSFKVTRDAELDLKDEYSGNLSDEIEEQLKKRDFGLATRFLVPANIPLRILQKVIQQLDLWHATVTTGGQYHNLKDLSLFPVNDPQMAYHAWPPLRSAEIDSSPTLFSLLSRKDIIVHTPYQGYHTILRFFNEAAINPDVEEISISLYRVASDSKIVHSLISAAKNGKRVQVVVELKARFDEANNLRWAKKMKAAGVKIIYSITANKVHAKIALIKIKKGNRSVYSGLLATGNFNETTAKFYTDHILLTNRTAILREIELLFIFLTKREKPPEKPLISFKQLLVAQFNLQDKFIELIEREIHLAKQSLPASIILKMNNLEERKLIDKLYEASQAGVKISLIIRSVCCLIPGISGLSENITIKRIVDRYLEHGRAFIFNNNGKPEVYLGSADWMNRNIYHRIEVCFPVHDEQIKAEVIAMINLELKDNVQAVILNENIENVKIESAEPLITSQYQIYELLKNRNDAK